MGELIGEPPSLPVTPCDFLAYGLLPSLFRRCWSSASKVGSTDGLKQLLYQGRLSSVSINHFTSTDEHPDQATTLTVLLCHCPRAKPNQRFFIWETRSCTTTHCTPGWLRNSRSSILRYQSFSAQLSFAICETEHGGTSRLSCVRFGTLEERWGCGIES